MKLEKFKLDTLELVNEMKLCFQARSENEAFARIVVTGFLTYINPTIGELEDIRMSVSEAVTNAIIHGYEEKESALVYVSGMIYRYEKGYLLQVVIEDTGKGIEDIEKAMEPMFTTKPDLERAGMGFAFMNAFMDEVYVESEPMKGTSVTLLKVLSPYEERVYEG